MNKICLYFYTIKDLKWIQIKYQLIGKIRKRGNKNLDCVDNLHGKEKFSIMIPELDLDTNYLMRFQVDRLVNEEVTLLNETHKVDLKSWKVTAASHLWNYNLHYLEFLIAIAVEFLKTGNLKWYKLWKKYIISWIENVSDDSYEPYTISMRIPNILISIEMVKEELKKEKDLFSYINCSIYKQYMYLQKNLEYRLLANHYFENIKALILTSVYFEDEKLYKKYYHRLQDEIEEQILPDGIHYELSMMYHHIILEDILRIYIVLKTSSRVKAADRLYGTIIKMTEAMCSLEKGMNRIPLFNDAGNNVAKSTESLRRAVERLLNCNIKDTNTIFPESGYAKLYFNNYSMIFDAGSLGPKYMSGHAHCDCLSFELFYKGIPIIVNSGTMLYQGKFRGYFRSTKANNTIMIDDKEQAQLWGEHRAAQKSKNHELIYNKNFLEGKFTNFEGDKYSRKIIRTIDGFEICDTFITEDFKNHVAKIFFHIGYLYDVQKCDGGKIKLVELQGGAEIIDIIIEGGVKTLIHNDTTDICLYADEFGKKQFIKVIELNKDFNKMVSVKTKIILKENR